MKAGEAIYVDGCSACHTRSGEGVPYLFPRLAGSQVVQQEGSETVLRIVLQGVRAAATGHAPTAPAMPTFGWRLDDEQVAAVVRCEPDVDDGVDRPRCAGAGRRHPQRP